MEMGWQKAPAQMTATGVRPMVLANVKKCLVVQEMEMERRKELVLLMRTSATMMVHAASAECLTTAGVNLMPIFVVSVAANVASPILRVMLPQHQQNHCV